MDEFLRNREAAKLLKCSPSKLAKGRSQGTMDIPFVKNGRIVLYAKTDLEAWMSQRKFTNTSQYETSKES